MTDVEAHKHLRATIGEAFTYANLKFYFPVFIGIFICNTFYYLFD